MSQPIENIDDPRLVRALSHPLRVRTLAILDERTASPLEISRILRADLGLISYHVRTLHRLGLIELVREQPVRGALQRFYRARPRPTVSTAAWERAVPVAKQALIGATLQQIGEYAERANAAGGFDRADAHLTRTALRLDAAGFDRLANELLRVLGVIDEIEEEVAARQAGGAGEPLRDTGLVMMLFDAIPFSTETGAQQGKTNEAGSPSHAAGEHADD